VLQAKHLSTTSNLSERFQQPLHQRVLLLLVPQQAAAGHV
jgi:hypothetical protein